MESPDYFRRRNKHGAVAPIAASTSEEGSGTMAMREDLRKPEKVTSPGGRVSIAATRDEAGHADHFWSLALALEAASKDVQCWSQSIPRPPRRDSWEDRELIL